MAVASPLINASWCSYTWHSLRIASGTLLDQSFVFRWMAFAHCFVQYGFQCITDICRHTPTVIVLKHSVICLPRSKSYVELRIATDDSLPVALAPRYNFLGHII